MYREKYAQFLQHIYIYIYHPRDKMNDSVASQTDQTQR